MRTVHRAPLMHDRSIQGSKHPSDVTALDSYGYEGKYATEETAFNYSGFWAGASVLCNLWSSLPISVFRERKSGTLEKADQHPTSNLETGKSSSGAPDDSVITEEAFWHPAYNAVAFTPNGYWTPSVFKSLKMLHKICSGNAVSEIVRNGRGQATQLHSFLPACVRYRVRKNGEPVYEVYDDPPLQVVSGEYPDFKPQIYDYSEVLHVKAMSLNGYVGKSVLQAARESLSLSLTGDYFNKRFFAKGGPIGFLTKANKLTEPQKELIRAEWKRLHEGVNNAYNVGLLSGGLDWKQVGFSNADAEMMATRKFQVFEMARWFGLSPHWLGETSDDKMTIEERMIALLTMTMLPHITQEEEEMNLKLLTPRERFNHCCRVDIDAYLRGDIKSTTAQNESDVRHALASPDEIRRAKGKNPIPGGYGKKFYMMASQLDTIDNVANGTSKLQGGAQASPDKPASKTTKPVKK